jgi:antitoxin VapB
MALSIKHPEADKLARELAELTGETLTEAVLNALRERVKRARAKRKKGRVYDRIMAIVAEIEKLPVLDPRPADEILGYDENGLPT